MAALDEFRALNYAARVALIEVDPDQYVALRSAALVEARAARAARSRHAELMASPFPLGRL